MGWRELVGDAELRTLLGRVTVRAMRADSSLEWFKGQLRRILDEDEKCEVRGEAAARTVQSRHAPEEYGKRIKR